MRFQQTRRIRGELGIIRRCLLDLTRSYGWDSEPNEAFAERETYLFSISIPRRLPFRKRTSISVRITLSKCDSATGEEWTQVEYSDDILTVMLRTLVPLCPLGLGISVLTLIWGIASQSGPDPPVASVILLVLFGFLVNAGTVWQANLLERDHYKRRVAFWQELTKNARECVTTVDDTSDEKFSEPFLAALACLLSFCCVVFLHALGMQLQKSVLLALLIFALPITMWLVSRRLSWRESPRLRNAVSLAADCHMLTLVVLTPTLLVYWITRSNAPGLAGEAMEISRFEFHGFSLKLIEEFSRFVVMIMLLMAPTGLLHSCFGDLEQYDREGRDARSIVSRGLEAPSSARIGTSVVRLLAGGLSIYSLVLTYLGLAFMLGALGDLSKLWLGVKELTLSAIYPRNGTLRAAFLCSVSLAPLLSFMIVWLRDMSRELVWLVRRPIARDSGSEFLDALTHPGMFQEIKEALGAHHLAVYKDPNPSGEYYFARQTAWSGIGHCYGLAVDLAAIAKFTMEDREVEAVIWHEVGHMMELSATLRLIARAVCLWLYSRISTVFQDSLKRELTADQFVTSTMGTSKPLRTVLVRVSQAPVDETLLRSQKKLSLGKALRYIIFSPPDLTYVHPHYELRYEHLVSEDAKQRNPRLMN